MKNITTTIKYLFVTVIALSFATTSFAYDDYGYGSYDAYDYGSYDSYNYGSYDAYDYGSYDAYDYGSYDAYDYGSYDSCYDCYSYYEPSYVDYYDYYDYSYDYGSYGYSYQPGYVYYGNNTYYGGNGGGGNNNNNNDNLEVECDVSDSTIEEGDTVTFTADVYGGDGPYDYEWDGDADGDSRSITERFDDEGDYSVTVTVTDDDGNRESDTCYIEVEVDNNNDDFDVTCEMSPRNPEEGERIRFTADVDGGNSPFDYEWSRDVDGDDRVVYETFNRDGDYEARVTVEDDDGNIVSDTCEFEVEDDDSNISVTSTTGLGDPNLGTPAVSAVYLSQVPYTGPGDTLVLLLWVVAGILLSAGIVVRTRKSGYRTQVKNRIAEFKAENKNLA